MLEDVGFVDVSYGNRIGTFAGAPGEDKARTYDVHGYTFVARKPG